MTLLLRTLISPVTDISVVQELQLLKDFRADHIKTNDYSAAKDLKLRVFSLDYDAEKHKDMLKSMTTLQTINYRTSQEFWSQQEK